MKRRVFLALVCSVTFIVAIYIAGCGQQQDTTTTTTTTTTTIPAQGTITLSGSLATGTISSAGIKSFAAASGYKVVAVNNETGQTCYSSTDTSGNFTIEIPSGESYLPSPLHPP